MAKGGREKVKLESSAGTTGPDPVLLPSRLILRGSTAPRTAAQP